MEAMSSFDRWIAERREAVASPTGNLALVDYQPVRSTSPTPIEGLPAAVALVEDRPGVLIDAVGPDGVRVDGEPIDGPTFVARLGPGGTPLVTWATKSVDVFSLDGSDYELRIYDSEAPNLARFDAIDHYAEDQAWRVPGSFRAFDDTASVPWDFTRAIDTGHTKSVPGVVSVTVDGTDYELLAFLDGEQLVLVFADGTTGSESYAPGRFLCIPAPEPDGAVLVDFNRAFIPPCGFSDFYSCPIPPVENRIAAPVRAGERAVLWKG